VLQFIIKQINILSKSEFVEYLPEAKKLLLEEQKDAPYVALALRLKCPVFSGDKKLKKISPVKILNPKEMMQI